MADLTPKKLLQRRSKAGADQTISRKKPEQSDPLAMEVKKRWEEGTTACREALFNYYLNFHFIEGNQWIFWNAQSSRLDEVPRDPEKVRLTVNRMRANSRTVLGKVNQRELTFEVLPSDADDSHLRGAKLAESQLEKTRQDHGWEQKRELNSWACWKGGYSAICVEWDPDAGDPAASPDDTGGVERKQGDTIETSLNASEFTVQPGTKDAEKGLWWVKLQLLPPEEAQDRHNLSWTPAADGLTAQTPYLLKMNDQNGPSAETQLTQVLTMYERPNKLCKKGRIVVVIEDQVVWQGEWPYPWTDHLNLAVARETPLETRWTGTTICSDARPIQTALNQSWSNIVEHMKRAGNARLAMPQSAVDMMDDLSDLPGEVLPYPDGVTQPPAWISPPGMPDWWIRQPQDLAGELDDVMGVHQVSRGEAPTNVESGYGLSILAEHDATPINRMVKETAIMWSKVATMVLKLLEVEVKTERKSLVTVPGQPPRNIAWSGKDFRGQTTAIVPQDAIIPRSRAAMMEFGKQAMEMGLINNLADFAILTELPSSRQILEGINPNLARARRENAGWASGHQSVPYEWDDHEQHIVEHNRYRMSLDYELLPQETKDLIETHIQAHVTIAAEKVAQQQMRGAMGGPGLAGAPTAAGVAGDPALNPTNLGIPVPPDPATMAPEAAPTPELEAADADAEKAAMKETVFNEIMASLAGPQTGAPE